MKQYNYSEIPSKAERFMLSDFESHTYKKSKYVKNERILDETHLTCPSCNTKRAPIEHGCTDKCRNCDLVMCVYGNGLNIWR